MPFWLIKGRFEPGAGIPDGDSVRFRPSQLALLAKLEGRPATTGTGAKTKGTVQLRLEGIDAIEKGAKKPQSVKARDSLITLLGSDPVTKDSAVGYILARMTDDKSGRPISFAFAGGTAQKDGAGIRLTPAVLRKSANWKQAAAGFAYPLFYNTLFADLREELLRAVRSARKARDPNGYWPTDATMKGVKVASAADLASIPPIWPKLWRRLQEYLRNGTSLSGFVAWLTERNERVDILSVMEERGLQDVVSVIGNRLKMTVSPDDVRVRAKAGGRK